MEQSSPTYLDLKFLSLTAEKIAKNKNEIYKHGSKYNRIQSWVKTSWYNTVLTLEESSRQLLQGHFLDKSIFRVIFSYLVPSSEGDFDARTDLVDDYDHDYICDFYEKPPDACSDNDFEGGFNGNRSDNDNDDDNND